ncbi:hypothetical protein ACE7GA_05635 [Roseomonas sp. CCTCC AB2023176]|uniref:hypothetical protein n=1 Tax=Roseomonas sp. CCTCC AB2023176 TaxID=3342640 RepID=UPI0035D948EF
MAVALPLVWPAVVAAGEAVVFVGSAALAALGIHTAVRAVEERTAEREAERTRPATVEDCPARRCPACSPPTGTIRVERIDRVPPSVPHHPCPGDHAHLVQMNQNPRTCACFWNKATPDVECLPPGGMPGHPMK